MADAAYAKLAEDLAGKETGTYDDGVRRDVLAFFAASHPPAGMRVTPKDWQKTQTAIDKLKSEGSATRVQQ
jgi:hypothetical protein